MIKTTSQYLALFEAMRPVQWIKNLNLFAAAILNGVLFQPEIFLQSLMGFITFSLLSSSSYLINDVVDASKDRLHPVKKNRPVARGALPSQTALSASFLLLILGLSISIYVSLPFFIISLVFIILQYLYSFLFKKKAVIDIIGIAFFFILRAYAGELATGYHLPIWIMLTVIFLSLFIASGKRRSELFNSGVTSRSALKGYGKSLLNFYTTMFAVCTLVTYSMYTFFEEKITFNGIIHDFLVETFPKAIDRKWYMVTIIPVIFGIMRYGQIIFEMQEGERPERTVATDIPLLLSVVTWGLMMIIILYVL